jgi:predicted nucleic acid-binding protein
MLNVYEKIRQEAWKLFKEREDVKLSFTDATCVTLARTHGISDIFTYNAREFRPFNFNVVSSV